MSGSRHLARTEEIMPDAVAWTYAQLEAEANQLVIDDGELARLG